MESLKPVGRAQVVGCPWKMQWANCKHMGLFSAADGRQRKSQIMIRSTYIICTQSD